MFTGLIEEVGKVQAIKRSTQAMQLFIDCHKVLEGAELGDSVAVNGVCLTLTQITSTSFMADVMPETLNKTNLGDLSVGQLVNLERALRVGDRLGGHFVQGHVDGVGKLDSSRPLGNAVLFRFQISDALSMYMVEKGSIAVNGISLTLVDVGQKFFTVSIIPHTLAGTNFQSLKPGDTVNLECDMIGKYISKQLQRMGKVPETLNLGMLEENGFI